MSCTAGRGRGRPDARNGVNRQDRGQDRNNAGDDEDAPPLFFQVRAPCDFNFFFRVVTPFVLSALFL